MKKAWIISGVIILLIVAAGIILYMKHDGTHGGQQESQQTTKSTKQNDGSVEQQQAPTVKDGISSTQAGNIAVQQYGGTVNNVTAITYNKTPTWEVEIDGTAQGKIKVEISQSDGTVLAMKKVGPGN